MGKKVAVDLFSGTGSATKAFRESSDWKVFSVEINENQEADLHKNVLNVEPSDLPDKVDFVWASPPCTDFSVACMYDKWSDKGLPKVDSVSESVQLVYHTLYLIHELNPSYWFMENPRGMLRKVLHFSPEGTVSYCQYGDSRMKPTDLWGEHPKSFEYEMCSPNSSCHESAPRGSSTGTQGLSGNTERSKIPYGLSKAVFNAVENPGKKERQLRLDI